MEEESLGPLILRGGTVKANILLDAIGRGRSIYSERHTVIDGNLDRRNINHSLSQDKHNRPIIEGDINIEHC